jgi:hypothetical protein
MGGDPLYELIVVGRLGPRLLQSMEGFEVICYEGGRTRLQGRVVDQAALHGLLRSLGDLQVEITSLRRLDPA